MNNGDTTEPDDFGTNGFTDPASPAREDPRALVQLGHFDSEGRAREFALVLRAQDIPHRVQALPRGFCLLVQRAHLGRAEEELELYGKENVNWPPREAAPQPGALWARTTIVYLGLLVLLFAFQHGSAFGFTWGQSGRVDAALMRSGEWWRAICALTLHIDLVHLLSNMTYGALFGGLVAYALGGGVGWFAVLYAGIVGNVLNALIHDPSHRSLGASTAVFGAVGVLAGSEVVRRHLLRQRHLRRAAPVLVAFLLLSYLGMGGGENRDQQTDVTAHLTGLMAGFLIGAPLGRLPLGVAQNKKVQIVFGLAALGTVAVGWLLAL